MTDPCPGLGATHFACDCFVQRLTKLEALLKAVREVYTPAWRQDELARHEAQLKIAQALANLEDW